MSQEPSEMTKEELNMCYAHFSQILHFDSFMR